MPLLGVSEVIPKESKLIVTVEMDLPVLTNIDPDELSGLQYLVKNASSAVWVTNSGLLDGVNPETSLSFGLAKTLSNEQPSFRMSCFDIEPQGTEQQSTGLTRSATFAIDQHIRMQDEKTEAETYLVEKNGIVYISRFLPDAVENAKFERIINPPLEPRKFYSNATLELDFRRVGQIESFYFKQTHGSETNLSIAPEEILVEPLAYSLGTMVCNFKI